MAKVLPEVSDAEVPADARRDRGGSVCLPKRPHRPDERVGFAQLREGDLPRLVLADPSLDQLLVTRVEMLRQLLDDFALARRIETKTGKALAHVSAPKDAAL
jgi:hypothetical protein